jgi:hypothetical protein
MSEAVKLDGVYVPSEDIVVREIEGELIIVPLTANVADLESALFTVNDTARAIWDRLDGKRTLHDIVRELGGSFEASPQEIAQDVAGFMSEVVARGIVVEAKR